MRRDDTFQFAAGEFAGMKHKFQEFCSGFAESYNESEYFPGVHFDLNCGQPVLYMFNREFLFDFAPVDPETAVFFIQVLERVSPHAPTTLARWYFNSYGDVKEQPAKNWRAYSIADKSFRIEVGNTIVKKFMEYAESTY